MTPEEFKNLKTGTKDPATPERVLATALWRLEKWQEMRKTGRNWVGTPVPAEDLEKWNTCMDNYINATCCILSCTLNEDGSIAPTHYYC